MKCPRCQAENVDGARFCEDCGARLEFACPSCGQPVSAGKKFCRSCGATLTTEPVRFASPESYTPKHLAEKILTSKAALEGRARPSGLSLDNGRVFEGSFHGISPSPSKTRAGRPLPWPVSSVSDTPFNVGYTLS